MARLSMVRPDSGNQQTKGERVRQEKMRHIMDAIEGERVYQINKWGDNPHELPGWLLIMQAELDEAKQAWCKSGGNDEALKEILQVIAVGVACLEEHGIVTRFGQGIRWEQEEPVDDDEQVFVMSTCSECGREEPSYLTAYDTGRCVGCIIAGKGVKS